MGNIKIDGQVWRDAAPYDGLPDFCVEVRAGSVSGPVIATAKTDASGYFSFRGLPDGSYAVCEILPPSGWTETWPTIDLTGTQCTALVVGWTFDLSLGGSASGVWFWNAPTSSTP